MFIALGSVAIGVVVFTFCVLIALSAKKKQAADRPSGDDTTPGTPEA